MAKEVSPELLNQITDYIKKRQKGEKKLLSFFYMEVFGVELKVNCGACVEDGFINLKTVINKKTKPVMNSFKWKGAKATAAIRTGNTVVIVGENNCNDELAELIEANGRYSHLVERISGTPTVEEKKSSQEVKEVYPDLKVTILTSTEVKTEEEEVKKKRGRPKSK